MSTNGETFDYDETTRPDLNAEIVRELCDPDPMVMLGKLAASCARTESAVRELSRVTAAQVKVTAEHATELRRKATVSNRLMLSAVVFFEVAIQVLQRAGVLK